MLLVTTILQKLKPLGLTPLSKIEFKVAFTRYKILDLITDITQLIRGGWSDQSWRGGGALSISQKSSRTRPVSRRFVTQKPLDNLNTRPAVNSLLVALLLTRQAGFP